MALTETPTQPAASLSDDAAPSSSLDAVLGSGDHKTTGRLWIGSAAIFLVAGAVVALIAAIEHADLSGFSIVDDANDFTQLWSLGRDLLLFGGIVPLLVGLAVFIVPLQVGSSSLAFPRGANAAYWTWLLGMILLAVSYPANGGPAGGRQDQVLMWTLALGLVLVALIWAMVCIASTVLGARATGMDLEMVPVSSWGFLVFSLVGLLSLPLLIAQLVLAYLDVKYGFLGDGASRTSLVGILDSAALPPAIYWIGIPALAIGLETIGVHSGRPLRFHRSVLVFVGILGILSFGADVFSFASRGRVQAFDNGLLVGVLIAAVLPVLASIVFASESLKGGRLKICTPLVAGLLSGVLLLAGVGAALLAVVWPIVRFIEVEGDTSVGLNNSFDLAGTSFHEGIWGLVLGAALLGVIAGLHHWGHKIWGRALDDKAGLLATVAAALGAALWGAGNIVAAFVGPQPRLPLADGELDSAVEAFNVVSAVGLALVAVAGVILLLTVARAAANQGPANEPWRGVTLEWATASPPIASNFVGPVSVLSSTPLIEGFTILGEAADAADSDAGDANEESA